MKQPEQIEITIKDSEGRKAMFNIHKSCSIEEY
jgi:hypothetical protein